ncbi:HAD family hydrolase [Methanoplanus limicola]|uniref:Haloacid dehalogenase domain protein hydrolase n=1 Tax=Methanoplanus limicola DSM 2279 TaxID=937775 RepID=H1Z444_9EURY|nr:HAD family hydrolase [Methanoplanus limicola]EHQ35723.1 Haloacid dehalogenase domain protein hydrolase [Methanoplanus limicola DSM 2279]
MKVAIVFDSAGTLLYTYRVAMDVRSRKMKTGVESTMLTCSKEGRSLILLYAHSLNIFETPSDTLLSDYMKKEGIKFGIACSNGIVTHEEVSEYLLNDEFARISDLQVCIKKVWNCCKKLPIVAMNSGVIVNRNLKGIEFTITSGGRPFSNAKEAVSDLHKMGVATYVASGDRTDKLVRMADYLGIAHDNIHGVATPSIKAQVIKDLKCEYDTVIMVGDGVNDIPALREADISVLTCQQNKNKPNKLIEAADIIINDVSEIKNIAENAINGRDFKKN